jgi:uncharacterized protein YceK
MNQIPDATRKFFTHYSLNVTLSGCSTMVSAMAPGKAGEANQVPPLKQLESDLLEIYKYEFEVLVSDKDIFDTPGADLLTLPLGEIDKWIVS